MLFNKFKTQCRRRERPAGRNVRAFKLARTPSLDAPLVTDESPGFEVGSSAGLFLGSRGIFWQIPGVLSTSVGYPVAQRRPGLRRGLLRPDRSHEAVRVVFDPRRFSYADLVGAFLQVHDPPRGCARARRSSPSTVRDLHLLREQAQVARRSPSLPARADQAGYEPSRPRSTGADVYYPRYHSSTAEEPKRLRATVRPGTKVPR